MGARAGRPRSCERALALTSRTPFDRARREHVDGAQDRSRTRRRPRAMFLRRSETAGITAGAISAGRICKWQGSAGASQAGSGVSGPPGMMPGWVPRPLALRARTGVALGPAKGGRGRRTQSRGWTHQGLVVEESASRLAVAAFTRLTGALSRCRLAPAAAGMFRSAGQAAGSRACPRPADAHRGRTRTHYVGTKRWGAAVGTPVWSGPLHKCDHEELVPCLHAESRGRGPSWP